MSSFTWTSHALQEHAHHLARFLTSVDQHLNPVSRPVTPARRHPASTPKVNVYADDSAVVLTCEVAGIAPEALTVSVIEDSVTIRGTRTLATGDNTTGTTPAAITVERTITLPFTVDKDHTQARLADGALVITLTRAAAAQPRTVRITAT